MTDEEQLAKLRQYPKFVLEVALKIQELLEENKDKKD